MFLKKILIGVGVLTILGAMLSSVTSCPITVKVDSDKAPNNTFTAQEGVAQLKMKISVAPVTVTVDPSATAAIVHYYADENISCSVTEESGVITVTQTVAIGIDYTGEINVILPEATYENFVFSSKVGSLSVTDLTASSASLEGKVGEMTLNNCTVDTLSATTNVGAIKAEGLKTNLATFTTDTGAVELNISGKKEEYSVDASANVGSVNATNQTGTTEKKITARTDVGSITILFS